MHRNTIAFVIVAAIGGFIGGFWLANSLNRSAAILAPPSATQTPLPSSVSSQNSSSDDLTDEELRAKIAEADRNPANFAFQRDLGIALYRWAAIKKDVELLTEAIRILERANSLKGDDMDVLVALGNAHFDVGFFKEDNASFQKARDTYLNALKLKPSDADVATDLGITYFLQKPPDDDKAIAALTKVSIANPQNDRESLQFLVRAFIRQGKLVDAEKALSKIKAINPANRVISELATELEAAKNGAPK